MIARCACLWVLKRVGLDAFSLLIWLLRKPECGRDASLLGSSLQCVDSSRFAGLLGELFPKAWLFWGELKSIFPWLGKSGAETSASLARPTGLVLEASSGLPWGRQTHAPCTLSGRCPSNLMGSACFCLAGDSAAVLRGHFAAVAATPYSTATLL